MAIYYHLRSLAEDFLEVADEPGTRLSLEVLLEAVQHLGELVFAQQFLQMQNGGLLQVLIGESALLRLQDERFLSGSLFDYLGPVDYVLVLLFIEGLQHILHGEFCDVPFLFFEDLLSLGSSEELYLIGHCYPLWGEGAIENLSL
jgi:hypothetical protein